MKVIQTGGTLELDSLKPYRKVTQANVVRSIIQDDYINLIVESSEALEFFLGDKIELDAQDYFLNVAPKVRKNNSRNFVYELRFEGVAYLLRKIKVFNTDVLGRDTDFNFSLTTDLEGFLNLIVNNGNRENEDWSLDSVPATDVKTITFNNQNALSALQDICKAYNTEFRFTKSSGKYKLSVGTFGSVLGYEFEYGKGKGLYALERMPVDNGEVVTRLYGFGSAQNLPVGYRDNALKLRMSENDYIEDGSLVALFGYCEAVEEFDIKPEFTGEVTSVDGEKLKSTDMDFDLNDYLTGSPAVVHFNSGRLAGYEFDIHKYNHTTKEFEIIPFEDERGVTMPDGDAFKISVGDTFTLVNITMPEAYVTNAEERLETVVTERYNQIARNNVKYTLEIDPLFMRGKSLTLGDTATVVDDDLNVNREIRIVKLERDLLSETLSVDLADTYEVTLAREIISALHQTNKEIQTGNVKQRFNFLTNYKRMRALQESIFDPDGYFDPENIKPASIETGMLS